MKNYVQYHNEAKQGPLDDETRPFRIFAGKPIHHLIGNRVWLISGRGNGRSPKQYYLRYVFNVDTVEEGPKNFAFGETGKLFAEPIHLNGLPWFKEFREAQQNFSLGVREVQESFLFELQTLVERVA